MEITTLLNKDQREMMHNVYKELFYLQDMNVKRNYYIDITLFFPLQDEVY